MWNPFAPCFFGHSRHWHNGPMVDKRRPKLCDRCQQPIGWVCEGEMLTEPLPQVVAGVPTGKAKRQIKRESVAPFRKAQR